MKVVVIIQARMSSSRLPGKVLMPIGGKTILQRVVEKADEIKSCDSLWVATSKNPEDDDIQLECDALAVNCYRGSLSDVRSRFLEIIAIENADIIVRITADNILSSAYYGDLQVDCLKKHPECTYTRMNPNKILYGSGVEVFRADKLKELALQHTDDFNKEHVTPALVEHGEVFENFQNEHLLKEASNIKVTIDTVEEFNFMTKMIAKYDDKDVLFKMVKDINNNKFET